MCIQHDDFIQHFRRAGMTEAEAFVSMMNRKWGNDTTPWPKGLDHIVENACDVACHLATPTGRMHLDKRTPADRDPATAVLGAVWHPEYRNESWIEFLFMDGSTVWVTLYGASVDREQPVGAGA